MYNFTWLKSLSEKGRRELLNFFLVDGETIKQHLKQGYALTIEFQSCILTLTSVQDYYIILKVLEKIQEKNVSSEESELSQENGSHVLV